MSAVCAGEAARAGAAAGLVCPVPERVGLLANSVQDAYAQYRELTYLRDPFVRSLTLTLSLVLLLSLLMAVWGAFFFSRRLTAPIQTLVAGNAGCCGAIRLHLNDHAGGLAAGADPEARGRFGSDAQGEDRLRHARNPRHQVGRGARGAAWPRPGHWTSR